MFKRTDDRDDLDNFDGIDPDRDNDRDDNDGIDADADRVDNDNVDGIDNLDDNVADQAARKFDEATLWLVKNDPLIRAKIDKNRAKQHCQPLDDNSIARAAKNRDNRARKRARAPIGADRPAGEGDRELLARGNFGGWPGATAFGSNLLSLDDPEQQQIALETLRDYVAAQLAKIDRGCGGRPKGDVGKAKLQEMLKALDLLGGGDVEKLQAVMRLLDGEGEGEAKAKATGTGKGGAA